VRIIDIQTWKHTLSTPDRQTALLTLDWVSLLWASEKSFGM